PARPLISVREPFGQLPGRRRHPRGQGCQDRGQSAEAAAGGTKDREKHPAQVASFLVSPGGLQDVSGSVECRKTGAARRTPYAWEEAAMATAERPSGDQLETFAN